MKVSGLFVWQSNLAGKPILAMMFPGVTEKTNNQTMVKTANGDLILHKF